VADNRIRFGTSGWRAHIADEFTFANVRCAVEAIAGHVKSTKKHPVLLVGHDSRFLSEEFSRAAARILRRNGIGALVCVGPTPTPAMAFEILRRKTDGAINFTASHNPAEYHGLKFSGADGGPALPEVTKDIEARAAEIQSRPAPAGDPRVHGEDSFETVDLHATYLARLLELVDFNAIRSAGISFVCDAVYGCGAGYLDRILSEQGVPVIPLRQNRDVLFGGHGPDPSESNLAPLRQAVLDSRARAGLATDGDADRFGILDTDGSFVQPNHVLALLYDYVVESRGWKLGAARSVATTHLLDAVARTHGVEVHQTPVGFKYIGELIKKDKIALGGEESAGLSIRGHIPEKDGILACLLVAEMMATRCAALGEQLRQLFRKAGAEFWPLRENLHLSPEVQAALIERLKSDFTEFAGRRVARSDRTDGLKLLFEDGSWLLLRLSGTEPLVRLYTETGSMEASRQLSRDARRWILP